MHKTSLKFKKGTTCFEPKCKRQAKVAHTKHPRKHAHPDTLHSPVIKHLFLDEHSKHKTDKIKGKAKKMFPAGVLGTSVNLGSLTASIDGVLLQHRHKRSF